MGTTPADLLAFDREHLWHPYTSMTEPTPVRLVTGAKGARIRVSTSSTNGNESTTEIEVVDGMSSWWAAIHGYRHPVLDEAVRRQVDDFSHVMFGGLTHEPAVRLGERLVEITPDGLEHVFLADSGSVSVEVALKTALQYQRGKGRPERTRMLTVLGGYHGDTFDCMSVTDPVGGMHSMWTGLLPEQVFGPQPPRDVGGPRSSSSSERSERIETPQPRSGRLDTPVRSSLTNRLLDDLGGDIDAWADEMRTLAAQHAHELAGLIVEPLLQGAGGMHPYPAACLQVLREIADEHDLVLIFDEIATGFGRTGHLFACEAAGVVPDVLCLGKALTGGYLTAAAVVTTTEVAHAVSASESGVLMHGPTFMGNPLACAVALASIDLLLAQDWQDTVRRINQRLTLGLAPLWGNPGVVDVRTIGAVGVVQLDRDIDMVAATDAALDAGAWLRPFRDMVYTMPPYVCSDDDLDRIVSGITAAVRAG